jgi:large subunit ribosomal protein L21
MYAIVNIAGQQFKVEKDQKLFVHRLEEKEGESVSFDEVLLIDNDKSVIVGEPTIKGAMISGKVISHPRGDKIKVFKKKRRKSYKVRTGHRQYLTEIQIENITEKGAVKESKAKTAAKKETAPEKPAETKATTTAETKAPAAAKAPPAAKKPATTDSKTKDVKKTAAKGPAAKKSAANKPAPTKPAAKKTAAARPAAKKPAAKKPDAGKETKE